MTNKTERMKLFLERSVKDIIINSQFHDKAEDAIKSPALAIEKLCPVTTTRAFYDVQYQGKMHSFPIYTFTKSIRITIESMADNIIEPYVSKLMNLAVSELHSVVLANISDKTDFVLRQNISYDIYTDPANVDRIIVFSLRGAAVPKKGLLETIKDKDTFLDSISTIDKGLRKGEGAALSLNDLVVEG